MFIDRQIDKLINRSINKWMDHRWKLDTKWFDGQGDNR